MGNHTVGGAAFGRRHFPAISRCLHQHHLGGGTALAHVVLRFPHPAAAARAEVAPHPVACQALAGGWVFGGDLGPVAVQFFSHQLGQPGQRALSHFRAGNADHHRVIRLDDNPGVDLFGTRFGAFLRQRCASEWHMKGHHQSGRRRSAQKTAP